MADTSPDHHRAEAINALESAAAYLEQVSREQPRNEVALFYVAEHLEALTHAVLYVGDQLAKGGDA